MKRLGDTYSGCKTYRDTGIKTTEFKRDQPFTTKTTFSTAFVRVQRFRFEYNKTQSGGRATEIVMGLMSMAVRDRMIVCLDETGIHSWWGLSGTIETHPNLMMALGKATGVSGGTAQTVPALLMPFLVAMGANIVTTAENLTRIEDAEQDGAKCFRIQSKVDYREPETYWIDRQSFLLRRIDGTMKVQDFSTVDTTIYQPEINVEITPEQLAFNPPSK